MKVSFKVDEDLQKEPRTSVSSCLTEFMRRGGTVVGFSDQEKPSPFELLPGDAVYPVCSGGVCRSQTLWAKLHPHRDKIVLFPPHAARHGWDPYNGKINRDRNLGQDDILDDFSKYFGMERSERFGFENAEHWAKLAAGGRLEAITEFYNTHYFGPESAYQGARGKRRVYVAFSNNIHVVLHRLVQANASLAGVFLVAVDWEDLVTHPPEHLNVVSRSVEAFAHFDAMLQHVVVVGRAFHH